MTENTHAGRLIVLTGPTAVGKGTVEAKLRADHPEVWVSVSATTRAPRPGEVDGVNYWFLTEDEFLAREAAGEFLETAVVHGMAHYGTLLKPVEEHLAAGVPTILEIDLQGARRVKQRAAELDLEVVYVFIAPPSFEELERRLIGRGTETAEQQARRLRPPRWSSPPKANSTSPSSTKPSIRPLPTSGPSSPRNTGCKLPLYHQLLVEDFGAVFGRRLLPADCFGFVMLGDVMPHPFEALLGLDGIA